MIRSMTGFGRATASVEGRALSIELKCVNSKQLDVNSKFPSRFREIEPEIKTLLSRSLVRGKVELFVNSESPERSIEFNEPLIKEYLNTLKGIKDRTDPQSSTELLPIVLRMPEVSTFSREALQDEEREKFMETLRTGAAQLDAFRLNEGKRMEKDLEAQVETISSTLSSIAKLDGGRIERKKEQLMKRLSELEVDYDESRLAQELVYYAEKLDVNEEKVRLKGHCDFFLETMHSSEISKGKKLGFIAQEMGREINTLGSKAGDAGIQHQVVHMKEALEKIKEQVLNVL